MAVLGENSQVKIDFEDWEKDESPCCSTDPVGNSLEPGTSQSSVNFTHSSSKVTAPGPDSFSLYDSDHKVLVLDSGILKAVPNKSYIRPGDSVSAVPSEPKRSASASLYVAPASCPTTSPASVGAGNSGSDSKLEIFFVLASKRRAATNRQGSPILLAVDKGKQCLYCKKEKDTSQPVFRLEKKKLGEAKDPFVFYKAQVGSHYTLESAACPGWFLCTSSKSDEPVSVTNKPGKKKQIEFLFEACKTAVNQ